MNSTIIQSPRSSRIEISVNQALTRLNNRYHAVGEPDVVVYKDGDGVNAMFTIGTKNGSGRDSYKIVSVRECDMIWGIIYNNLPTIVPEKRYFFFKDLENNWFLVDSNTKIQIPDKTYTDISTGKIYVVKEGIPRDICDFLTKDEINELIAGNTDGIKQADWNEFSPQSNSFIRNKPTSFSNFEDDISYSLSQIDTTSGFYSSFRLLKDGVPVGDMIDIPKDKTIKSGSIKIVSQEDKQPGGNFYDSTNFSIGDPYLDIITGYNDSSIQDQHIYTSLKDLLGDENYTAGQGININNRTISINIVPGNGFNIYTEGIMVSDVTNNSPGAMTSADYIKLENIDTDDLTKKEDLLSGAVEVKISESSKNIISPSGESEGITSEGFSFRSTAGSYSVGPGEATLKKLGGSETPFTPISLKTHSNNAIVLGNKKANTQINSNKKIISSSIINYSIYWFPCIKGILSTSIFDLQNNGYSITSFDTPLGLVGFTTQEPDQYISEVEEILIPTITPYSNLLIHYLPPSDGWIIVTVKNEAQDKLCARLSWSGAYDKTYETAEESNLILPGTAIGKTIGENTIEDYWYDNNGTLSFHRAYGMENMTSEKWGELQTSTGDHDPTKFIVRYKGSSDGPVQILSPSLTILPERMYVDGEYQSVTREYSFGDDLVHEIKFEFGTGIELPSKAFLGITGITSIITPISAQILGVECFMGCTNLRTVTLSPNLDYIGASCFSECNNLDVVYVFDPTPANIFYNTFPNSCNFYVPGDYMINYTTDSMWSSFGDKLKQGERTRYYYKYDGLRGIIKEYTPFIIGLPGVSVTDLGTIEADNIVAPEGTLYYELKTKTDTSLNISSNFSVWDYGTEKFESGQTSGKIEIIYPVSLFDDLRHSETMLSEKLEETDIDSEMSDSSLNPVQNKILKEYIDSSMLDVTDICKDLSRIDSFGNPLDSRNTANCYIISKPGIYRIPLVYGNAIKNGVDNPISYRKLDYDFNADFYNALGRPVVTPGIEQDLGETITRGTLVWESNNIIDKDKIEIIPGNPFNYVVFRVIEIPTTGGNAVIGIGNDNTIFWSWHIWATKENITPVSTWNRIESDKTSGTEYMIMPINLGWTWDTAEMLHGKNVFYQWGRKDPIPGPSKYNSTSDPTLYEGGFNYNDGTSGTVVKGITSPNICFPNSSGSWCELEYYYNYWDSNYKDLGYSDVSTTKTIYDPCPTGWKVPPGGAFRGSVTGTTKNVIGGFNVGYYIKRFYGDSDGLLFQASGCRTRAAGNVYGSSTYGYYWTASSSDRNAYILTFSRTTLNPIFTNTYSSSFSIRPVLE